MAAVSTSRRARVLLTDAQERAVLAAARSLHRAGYEVAVAASVHRRMTHFSRCCDQRVTLPNPVTAPEQFAQSLELLLARGRYDVLLPGTDAVLRTVVAARAQLEPHTQIGLPPADVITRTFDRLELAAAAQAAGFASPPGLLCNDHQAVISAARELGFPIVLKTRWPVRDSDSGLIKVKSRLVVSEAALAGAMPQFGGELLVQSVVPGEEISCAGVMTARDGLLALVVSRYERTWPVVAGDVCFSVTIPVPDGLAAKVNELMRRLGWTGIFELELIRQRDGSFAPIDLNPRVYGSLALAVGAGVPLPVLWVNSLLGVASSFVAAPPGVRYRREDGDLPHAIWQLRRGHWRSAVAPLRPRRHVSHALFEVRDPAPLLVRAGQLARSRLRGRER